MESPFIRTQRELLQVGSTATLQELKKAYHRLALLYHPDRNKHPEAASQFAEVRKAFETLSDPVVVRWHNQNALREKLFKACIASLNVCFGSFFGYRQFSAGTLVERRFRLGAEKRGEKDRSIFADSPQEMDVSILDHPAFDDLELVFAGQLSPSDGERLVTGIEDETQKALPWVVENNQGILYFLEGKYAAALACYERLNARIPRNIIFFYRLGLCHVLTAFDQAERRKAKPDLKAVNKGTACFRACIRLGETRPVGRQKCLVIRKILAEVLEKTGKRKEARKIWEEVRIMVPTSIEANLKSGHSSEAKKLIEKRQKQTAVKGLAKNKTLALQSGLKKRP